MDADEMMNTIEEAVKQEREAYNYYMMLKGLARDAGAEKLFMVLAMEEMKHEALLQEFLFTGNLKKAKEKSTILDFGPKLKEALEGAVKTTQLEEGFKAAIGKEIKSQQRYKVMMDMAQDENQRLLFQELIGEEKRHETLLKIEYDKLYGKGTQKIYEKE